MTDSPRPITIEELRKELPPQWDIIQQSGVSKLQRVFKFSTYSSGVDMVVKLANLANTMDHHPDILLGYKIVTVEIFTHSINGISALDLQFVVAVEKFSAHTQHSE